MTTTTSLFKLKTVNDVLRSARHQPISKKLFVNFWSTGETAILLADSGMGKSTLAVQIAQSIASGNPAHDPAFAAAVEPQSVLYLDLEMSEKQFEMRYCDDLDDDEQTRNHFVFSDNFHRAEIDMTAEKPEKYRSFGEFLIAEVEGLLEKTGAKILIVDNITSLSQNGDNAREAIELMRGLKTLKDKHRLSVLALAHTRRRSSHRPLSLADLPGSRVLANFADSIFAIGESSISHDARYIKDLKQRNHEMQYDASHVPGFTLSKSGGNFLGFRFIRFSNELDHLKDHSEAANLKYQRTMRIQSMIDRGMSQRAIAAELGISAATVNRYRDVFSEADISRYFPDLYMPVTSPAVPARNADTTAKPPAPNAKTPARPLFVTKPINEWFAETSLE